jgi:hypothetical protein
MGEKPPNIIGEGNNITMKQAPTVISFPPSQQFPEEFLELALLTQNSSAFSLIVVIFPMVSILTNSFALLPMHLPSAHLHQFPTPTINTSTINTTPLVAYTTALQIECIYLTGRSTLDLGVGIIQIKHDFSTSLPEWYSNILPLSFNGSFTISTATTGPTTATKASAFTTIPRPAAIVNNSAESNINTTAPQQMVPLLLVHLKTLPLIAGSHPFILRGYERSYSSSHGPRHRCHTFPRLGQISHGVDFPPTHGQQHTKVGDQHGRIPLHHK